ncbi:MAG: hypothetical protein QM610_08180 [Chitinophagaceae bacterium]
MEIVALVVVMGVCLALVFGLPFGVARYGYLFLKKKNVPFYWRWIAVVPALVILYLVASAILPEQHIYKLDYKEIMAYDPPADVVFFAQTSGQYGRHAEDYSFGIHTHPQNYSAMLDLVQRRGFVKDSATITPDSISVFLKKNKLRILQKLSLTRYSKYDYYVDFLSDSSTVFMRKVPK